MPITKIHVRPGINTQATQTLNSGGWSLSNLIRFRQGFLEKIGGWKRFSSVATMGIARALHAFQDLNSNDYLAVGSTQRLQVYSNGAVYDITPIRKTSNLTTPITTNYGGVLGYFLITDTNHGATAGDTIYIPLNVYANNRNTGSFQLLGPESSVGVYGNGFYKVQTVVDSNNYTIGAFLSFDTNVTGVTSLFTTTITSNSVTVTLGAHGFSIGSVYTVFFSTSVGGLTLSGSYIVNTVIDNSNFTILAAGAATSSATASENSGLVQIRYLFPTRNVSDTSEVGYGTGGYGLGPYGQSSGAVYISPLRNWFLDNFGQNLVALPTGGTLYQWVPPPALGNVATAVTNAPLYGNGMFVAMPQAQVVILGAEVLGTQDPLLVRWCDNGAITVWTATVTNQAGSYRLSRGSRIVGGIQGPQFGLIWTDIDIWVMNYQGYPLVYGFNIVGEQVGLIAPKAANLMNGTAYWMSIKGFFQYSSGSGGVQPIACTVWDEIFTRLDTNNLAKTFAAPNSLFNEMAWFFASTDSSNPVPGEIDSYGKYNIAENLWDYGTLTRFSWIDESIFGSPIGVDGANLIQQHEIGYDADTIAMANVYAQTGYVDISDGDVFIFVDWLIPDFVWKTTQPTTQPRVTITVYTLYTPGDPTPSQVGPFTVTPTTPYISFRTRARQMSIRIESDTIDTFWRVGAVRYRGARAGRV